MFDSTSMLVAVYKLEGQRGKEEQLFIKVKKAHKVKLGGDHLKQ